MSNITAGNETQIQTALDVGMIEKLVHILQFDDDEIRKEAVWALANATQQATPEQILTLVKL